MTRTNLITSIASALGAMMLFTTAAQACISCEYVPEVLNSKNDSRRSYRPDVSYSAKIEMRERMARAQAAKARMANLQAAKIHAAKVRAAAAKRIETASITQKDETDTKPKAGNTASEPAASGANREKPVSTATLLVGESVSTEAEPGKAVECKKLVAAVGTTVTVPCK